MFGVEQFPCALSTEFGSIEVSVDDDTQASKWHTGLRLCGTQNFFESLRACRSKFQVAHGSLVVDDTQPPLRCTGLRQYISRSKVVLKDDTQTSLRCTGLRPLRKASKIKGNGEVKLSKSGVV